jgi:uncharacterized protein YjiK
MQLIPAISVFLCREAILNKWKITLGVLGSCAIAGLLSAQALNRNEASSPGLKLDQYHLMGNPITLSGIADNASGLTYNHDNNTLFAIINNPEQLIELNADGKVLRRIQLQGFEDTEGLAYMGNNQFAIIEERKRTIVLVAVTTDTLSIARDNQRSLSMPDPTSNNNGFEGLTIDLETGRLFLVNEKSPRKLIQIDGFASNQPSIAVSSPMDLENNAMGNRDFSGVHFDPKFRRLILLSDESKQLVEVGLDGVIGSRLKLKSGHAGLTQSIQQAEGVTLDNNGTLYVLSEPNLLYKFHFNG